MKAIQKVMIPVQRISMNEWYIHFNIEDKTDAEGNAYQEADEITVNDPANRDEVIVAVIRSKYSQDAVEAIINNYLAGDDTNEYTNLQLWRKVAKAVADGKYLKTDIDTYLGTVVIEPVIDNIIEVLNDKGILS